MKKPYLLTIVLACSISVSAQVNQLLLQQALDKQGVRTAIPLRYPALVREFYQAYQYKAAWLGDESTLRQLLENLDDAPDLGLRKEEYQPDLIKLMYNKQIVWPTTTDSLLADIRMTDIAIHFFQDVAFGNSVPEMGYNGLNYFPDCLDIPSMLAAALSSGKFSSFIEEIESKSPEYLSIKKKIIEYNKAVNDTAYRDDLVVTSLKVNSTNKPLLQKLYELQLIESPQANLTDKELAGKVKAAQHLFDLLDDGILRSTILQEMNVPLTYRVEELCRALNTMRWLRCIKEKNEYSVVINIPSANLLVFGKDSIAMRSKIIVGKRLTPTPTLCSGITEVIIYPYWMVPKKIATRELLPLIKLNPKFLDMYNFQVINQQGKVVDPGKIDWHKLHTGYFPYTLRQSTGCDNSLGIIKLNFYNPYTVYLHDTPGKILFSLSRRYFSHGCMRVEKAVELARLVLREKAPVMDTLMAKGWRPNQEPVTLTTKKAPVFVLYNTAWIDRLGDVRFFEDVYRKMSHRKR